MQGNKAAKRERRVFEVKLPTAEEIREYDERKKEERELERLMGGGLTREDAEEMVREQKRQKRLGSRE